jgi:hypothetical protein
MICVLCFSLIQFIIFSYILLEVLETIFEKKINFQYVKKMLKKIKKSILKIIHQICDYFQNYKLFDIDVDFHIKIKS